LFMEKLKMLFLFVLLTSILPANNDHHHQQEIICNCNTKMYGSVGFQPKCVNNEDCDLKTFQITPNTSDNGNFTCCGIAFNPINITKATNLLSVNITFNYTENLTAIDCIVDGKRSLIFNGRYIY
jgi:hypothetical protein